MEDEQDGQQSVEDVVGREHLHQLRRLHNGAVQDPGGEYGQAGCYPARKLSLSYFNLTSFLSD